MTSRVTQGFMELELYDETDEISAVRVRVRVRKKLREQNCGFCDIIL